jgi:hypothetical protein
MIALTARINNSTKALEIFNAVGGGILRTHSLPPGTYSNLAISGDVVSVQIATPYAGEKLRTINMKTGALISEISF